MLSRKRLTAASLFALGVSVSQLAGCATDPTPQTSPPPSPYPAVSPPAEPEPGEVARFSFIRPGNNQVAVGPYLSSYDQLVVRGACRSESAFLTWTVFDNTEGAADDAHLDTGTIPCDGATHEDTASTGEVRELGIFGVTGTPEGRDALESAWLTLAND